LVSPRIVAAITAAVTSASEGRYKVAAVKKVGGVGYNPSLPWILSGRQELVLTRQLFLSGRKGN
jgi:hypothetical protein